LNLHSQTSINTKNLKRLLGEYLMDTLNQLRLLAGLPIDISREITKKEMIIEKRNVPLRRSELNPKDAKHLQLKIKTVQSAVKHLSAAIAALEKSPATDFMGDIPHYINELEELLHGDGNHNGMFFYLDNIQTEFRKWNRANKKREREEQEEVVNALAKVDAESDVGEEDCEMDNYSSVVESKLAKKDYDGDGKIET